MGKSYNEYRIMAFEDTFGYNATWIYKDCFETLAEVKSYLRHFYKVNDITKCPITLWVEVRINDEDYGPQSEWHNLTQDWDYRAMEEIEDWCERKGLDFNELMYGDWGER